MFLKPKSSTGNLRHARNISEQDVFRLCHSPTVRAANGRVIPNPHYIGPYIAQPEDEEDTVVERPLSRYNYNGKEYQRTGKRNSVSSSTLTRKASTSSFVPVVSPDTEDDDDSYHLDGNALDDTQLCSFLSLPATQDSRSRSSTISSRKSIRFSAIVTEKEIFVEPSDHVEEELSPYVALCRKLSRDGESSKPSSGLGSSLKKIWRAVY
ncbi:hypothetical protein PM082_022645 [Marasmius tenuissimus]|nr:hypothetical protein PM082_022645 [Marasmius tenuissimus]